MNCQFSFGPNRSYFCSAGSGYAWSDNFSIPEGLLHLLEDKNHPQAIQAPHDVAFPMEPGMYALCWKTTAGEEWYEDACLGPNYARLAAFIKSVATSGGRTMRTVFGPGASYFSISPSGYCWQNLPPALQDDINNCIKTRQPTTVALGVQGSYAVLYNDGSVSFDLCGQYPLVESFLRNTQESARKRGIMYIALNPFIAGEYYAVYGDGSASWNLPTAWSQNVTTVSQMLAQETTAPPAYVTHIVAPAPAPMPIYVPTPVSPYTSQPPAPVPSSPPAHKVNWQEGLMMGLKAAEGITKIVVALEGQPDQNQNAFNFGN
ncbi:hypothetical protein C8R44DRAFT_895846 [Mycena epipterygia]|nr:hypothetical protein C8R44DRAFT_895846 [Mycena epipterygia]